MKIKKYIFYPEDFFHFEGVEIDDDEINKWKDGIYKTLKESKKKEDYNYHRCGNTMVIGLKNSEGIEIYVCKNYHQTEVFTKDIIK